MVVVIIGGVLYGDREEEDLGWLIGISRYYVVGLVYMLCVRDVICQSV